MFAKRSLGLERLKDIECLKNKGKDIMPKIDEIFITKNKNALLEEIAENINTINSLVNAAAQTGPTENPAHELSVMKNIIIAIAQNCGSLTSCFNQYMIFDIGKVPEERRIGFSALMKSDEDEKIVEEGWKRE